MLTLFLYALGASVTPGITDAEMRFLENCINTYPPIPLQKTSSFEHAPKNLCDVPRKTPIARLNQADTHKKIARSFKVPRLATHIEPSPCPLEAEVLRAIWDKDEDAAIVLLEQLAQESTVIHVNHAGETLFHDAAHYNCARVTAWLIHHYYKHDTSSGHAHLGKVLFQKNTDGNTPFLVAAQHGSIDFIKSIATLFNNAREIFNVRLSAHCPSPLFYAAQHGQLACVQFLLEIGVDIWHSNELADDACSIALKNGHLEIAELLFEHKKRHFETLLTTRH